mmetsp:Transcript_64208/g.71742  ORF Transcript_64208/g.71742 Transcript_64208/m.71742 type:complete len:122 (+) Transcript_64208:66-431(+)
MICGSIILSYYLIAAFCLICQTILRHMSQLPACMTIIMIERANISSTNISSSSGNKSVGVSIDVSIAVDIMRFDTFLFYIDAIFVNDDVVVMFIGFASIVQLTSITMVIVITTNGCLIIIW